MKLKIEKISNQALGIAKDIDGKKYFIAKTAPNDEIDGEIIKKNSKFTLVKIKKLTKKVNLEKIQNVNFLIIAEVVHCNI